MASNNLIQMSIDIVKLDLFDGESFKRWQKKPWLNPVAFLNVENRRHFIDVATSPMLCRIHSWTYIKIIPVLGNFGKLSRNASSRKTYKPDIAYAFQALAKETLVESREFLKFGNDDFIRRGHIPNAMPDPLLDVYQNYPSARELWKALKERFFTKDAQVRNLLFLNLTYNTGRCLAQNKYAKVIGNLMYDMTCTRPDIAYAVEKSSRHTNSLGKEH
ncbi:hypothetical protein Tco_1352046 [Tanacetum coccineum]